MVLSLLLALSLASICLWPSGLPAQTVVEPDFAELTELLAATLQSNGPSEQAGDRTEQYRFSPEGWEVQVLAVWSGHRWMLMAAHVHHPQRAHYGEGEWSARYASLLERYDPAWVERLRIPDLFEVPPPDYLPAVPDEVRGRRFTWQGYWYEVRWFNSGGVDDAASWSLVSYDLVALEPPVPAEAASEAETDARTSRTRSP